MEHPIQPESNGSSGHEHREVDLKLILWSTLGLAVATAITFVLVFGIFGAMKSHPPSTAELPPMAPPIQLPPEPRLEVHPWDQLKSLRAHEQEALHSYGWQDQKNGIVHMPIEQAIDMVVAKGLPYRQAGAAASAKPAKPAAPAKRISSPAPSQSGVSQQ